VLNLIDKRYRYLYDSFMHSLEDIPKLTVNTINRDGNRESCRSYNRYHRTGKFVNVIPFLFLFPFIISPYYILFFSALHAFRYSLVNEKKNFGTK